MKSFFNNLFTGILAGIMIVIGSSVFVACDNKYVGAILFSVALLTICIMGFNLYTGKIGFIVNEHKKSNVETLLTGILGNVIATFIFGYLVSLALPSLNEKAILLVNPKLDQTFIQTLIRGTFCGILMYVAVGIYRDKKKIVGILFCIPVFILCGFEHSIADMAYFSIANVFSFDAFIFIMTVVLGNSIGAVIIPLLSLLGRNKNNENS